MYARQIAQRPIMATQQKSASQSGFDSDDLIQRINLQAGPGERRRRHLTLATGASCSWCSNGTAEGLTLALPKLVAIPYQGERCLWSILPSKKPGEIASRQAQLVDVLCMAEQPRIVRMRPTMTAAIGHDTSLPVVLPLRRQ
jgi:hypothetical protein